MFDWARGSVLRKMIQLKIPGADYDTWLKGWAWAWPLSLLSIPRNIKTLDVGTGGSLWYPNHFSKIGCEAHVLDGPYKKREGGGYWGISKHAIKENPNILFHIGLAGDYKISANRFDLITCVSVMEHIYDSTLVLDPKNPYPHLDALSDMVHMLAPGGLLVLTYDFVLNDMPHWRGWDYLADFEILRHMGLSPLRPKVSPKSRTFIYNYEDTLFMGPEGILSFSKKYFRTTSIGMIFVKPGTKSKITFHPHYDIMNLLFLESTSEEDPTLVQLKHIIIRKTKNVSKNIARNYIQKIKKFARKSS